MVFQSCSYFLFHFQLNILCCAFIGSFLITLTIDVWIEAGLKFIIVNTFRHAYIDGYLDVIVTGPFQIKGKYIDVMSVILQSSRDCFN